jgi:ribonuclease Z
VCEAARCAAAPFLYNAGVKSAFLARLVNGPFGDPGLHVSLRWRGTALQLDLGRLDRMPAAELLKLTHAFVSHTHLDHFIGFDRLLRLFLARDAELSLFGPPGIIGNVTGKLAGYTWNLVEGYPFVLNVHEVHTDHIRQVRLRACTAFAEEEVGQHAFSGVLHDEPAFSVRAVHLDHKIACLAFAVVEKTHLNVRKDELERLGIPAGPWLNALKDAIRRGQPGDTPITPTRPEGGDLPRAFPLRELRDRLVVETPGQKLAYVVDTLFSKRNVECIVDLAREADLFYCESLFLDADRDQALKRYHLTARQAGSLARMADVKRLEVFHFSPRYDGMAEKLYSEAAAAFRGELAADEPL